MTVATSNWEFALEQKELTHSCDPIILEKYRGRQTGELTDPFLLHKRRGGTEALHRH